MTEKYHNNCFEKCIAFILKINSNIIPKYKGNDWFNKYNKWVFENYKLKLLTCKMAEPFIDWIPDNICYIVSGELKEGGWHARIRKDNKIIFDPSFLKYKAEDFKYGYWEWNVTVIIEGFYINL